MPRPAGAAGPPLPSYSNLTLTSRSSGGSAGTAALSAAANVFLPPIAGGDADDDRSPKLPPYYASSRFEGGSMIGPVRVVDRSAVSQRSREPWHLHKNCWRFPGCYNDIPIDGGVHGHEHGLADMNTANAEETTTMTARPDEQQEGQGDEDDALDVLQGIQRNTAHRHAHDHHGGHRPAYYYHRGFGPDYAFLDRDGNDVINGGKGPGATESHMLYGTDLWKVPHDPQWPESGVGLASEFGYGDDGANCVPSSSSSKGGGGPCGWITGQGRPKHFKITNGVLGYERAAVGEPFLKIGVGKLIKGSCLDCNATDETDRAGYKFNSPYEFHDGRPAQWTILRSKRDYLVMEHEATIRYDDGKHSSSSVVGYRLRKTMRVDGSVLIVQSTLTNLGTDSFATPWYSHHFFTCDGLGVGPAGAYGVDLELKPVDTTSEAQENGKQKTPIYEEGGVGVWSEPLSDYAEVTQTRSYRHDNWFDILTPSWWRDKGRTSRKTTQVTLTKEVEDGTRIKAEFRDDGKTGGAFVLHGCGTSIAESIPELDEKYRPVSTGSGSALSMYAFNLYIERGTLSPEPLMLIELDAGATTSWTQRVEFGMDAAGRQSTAMPSTLGGGSTTMSFMFGSRGMTGSALGSALEHIFVVAMLSAVVAFILNRARSKRRSLYTPISDGNDLI